ncbi:hypothetical protein, partial [Blautia obeum]|uniref:hypothetical protein n=1 Tax=Blautia obeum TaxID=40520 RepID=UPI001FAB4402
TVGGSTSGIVRIPSHIALDTGFIFIIGETDEASGKKTNEKSTHACRNCLHIDFSAGSYGAGNAFY